MPNTNTAVAVFHSHQRAEEAIRELQISGFDMRTLSVIGYEAELMTGKFILIVHGTHDEVERAKARLDDAQLVVHAEPVALVA